MPKVINVPLVLLAIFFTLFRSLFVDLFARGKFSDADIRVRRGVLLRGGNTCTQPANDREKKHS